MYSLSPSTFFMYRHLLNSKNYNLDNLLECTHDFPFSKFSEEKMKKVAKNADYRRVLRYLQIYGLKTYMEGGVKKIQDSSMWVEGILEEIHKRGAYFYKNFTAGGKLLIFLDLLSQQINERPGILNQT